MQEKTVKIIGLAVLLAVVLNLALFAFVITNWLVFWGILAAAFFFVKWMLPRIR
ncbi:MAG TPA: hypothetical protein VJC21_02055 [Candidatus Nanoarchaeia archaeon]|nr:hypothetical protein [Candidatus Nanoarchaeia archaeon]